MQHTETDSRKKDIDVIASPEHLSGLSFRLRPTLLVVLLGLLVATVASIGAVGFVKTSESIETLAQQQFSTITRAAVNEVQNLVWDVPQILREYEVLAQRGLLPTQDPDALGAMFVERLRQNDALAWFGFGDSTSGGFIGATRRGEAGVRLYSAQPDINDSIPVEVQIEPSGQRLALNSDEKLPYRVTQKEWFKQAMALNGVKWLTPYTFTDGRRGVTAVLKLVLPETRSPVGVLHVDLFVDRIAQFLDSLTVGQNGRVHLLDSRGQSIAAPTAWAEDDPALISALNHLGGSLSELQAEGASIKYDHKGEAWRAWFAPIDVLDGPRWIVCVVASEAEFTGVAVQNAWWTLAAGMFALALAAMLSMIVSSKIAVPLRRISEDLERLAVFSFDDTPLPTSFIREVEVVGQTVQKMKSSLRSFGRYVPADLVRKLLESGQEAELGGVRRTMTIQFSDIAGFIGISEKLPPEELVTELGHYFLLMSTAIEQYKGTLDKYMGDGIMAFFNAPRLTPDHETLACLAALESQKLLVADRIKRTAEGRPTFEARIGLAVGEVVVGNIGTPNRLSYTVIGDTANLAARLESICKYYGAAITVSGDVRAATGNGFEWRYLDRVAVVGRAESTDIHELLCQQGELTPDSAAARDAYEAALGHYLDGEFDQAATAFHLLYGDDPEKVAEKRMYKRASLLASSPPEGIWTGVYPHTEK